MDDNPQRYASLSIALSWFLIALSTAVIFVGVQRTNTEDAGYAADAGAFQVELIGRMVVGMVELGELASGLDPQALPEGDGSGTEAEGSGELVPTAGEPEGSGAFSDGSGDEASARSGPPTVRDSADQMLADLEPFAVFPASARRIAILHLFVHGEAGRADALRLLELATTTRRAELETYDADVPSDFVELEQTALAIDEAMLAEVRDGRPIPDEVAEDALWQLGWFWELYSTWDADDEDAARQAAESVGLRAALASTFVGLAAVGLFLFGIVAWFYIRSKRDTDMFASRMAKVVISRPELFLEAFAAYLTVTLIFDVLMMFVPLPGWLGMIGIASGSVLGVLWPIFRGISKEETFEALGFTTGDGLLKEIGWGIAGYAAILPIMALGVVASMALGGVMEALGPAPVEGAPPDVTSHPSAHMVAFGGWWTRLINLFLAAAFAPFFEELLFRGALFGYLRTKRAFFGAAFLMAFIFAVLHPQGIEAVPVLMALAIGFAWLRHWRGSLVAPMTAHAIHNGAIMTLLILIFM